MQSAHGCPLAKSQFGQFSVYLFLQGYLQKPPDDMIDDTELSTFFQGFVAGQVHILYIALLL